MEAGGDVEEGGDDGGEGGLGGRFGRGEVEDAGVVGDLRGGRGVGEGGGGSGPASGEPRGGTDILDVDGGDPKVFSVKPFHLFVFRLVDAGQAEAASEETYIVFTIDVSEAEYGIAEPRALLGLFTFGADLLQGFFGQEFVFGEFEPGFGRRGFRAAACCDCAGRGGFVDHTRAELYVGWDMTAGAFAGQRCGEGEGACGVNGVFLRVVSLAAAVEDIAEGPARGECEDFGEGFCQESCQRLDGGEKVGGGLRSRLASACINLSAEQASENSGASQASWGRTLSTRRTSEARLFWWM